MPRRPGAVVLRATCRAIAATGAAVAALALAPRPAWAHPGRPIAPHDLWSAWTFDPGTVLALGLAAALYVRNGNVIGAGQPVLTGQAFIDSSNVSQIIPYAKSGKR